MTDGRPFFKPVKRPITRVTPLELWAPVTEVFGLDATAGFRKMWRGRDMRGWVFVDKRRTVKPDIVCSNELLPFRPGTFQEILFDPPSLLSGGGYWNNSHMAVLYHWWKNKGQFRRNLSLVNEEFLRVLKLGGILTLKYTEGKQAVIPYVEVLERLVNFEVVSDVTRPSRSGNKNSVVHLTVLNPSADTRSMVPVEAV